MNKLRTLTELMVKRLVLIGWLSLFISGHSQADLLSARMAMENQSHPLLLLMTARGDIYVELFPAEAPGNVSNFLNLVAGDIESFDGVENSGFTPGYYDSSEFHRAIPGFLIQAGSPFLHPLGMPNQFLDDEIDASALGLDRLPVLGIDGNVNPILNVGNQQEFAARVLEPLYAEMNIDSVSELDAQQYDVASELRSLTVMRLYEHEGYEYQNQFPTRGITEGIVALANDGPNRNGPEFFIALQDAQWLNGRYTVIGKVVEGIDVADQIGAIAVEPTQTTRDSTAIYSIRRVN